MVGNKTSAEATWVKPSEQIWQLIDSSVQSSLIIKPTIHELWESAKNCTTCWTANFIWAVGLLSFFLYIFYSTLQFIGASVIKWKAATAWTVRKKNGRVVCNRQIALNISWWARQQVNFTVSSYFASHCQWFASCYIGGMASSGSSVVLTCLRIVYRCTRKAQRETKTDRLSVFIKHVVMLWIDACLLWQDKATYQRLFNEI